ncbi:DUF5681 domain-containing protein [Qipengyuania sp.]|uniref:DUF5681 domain-containing protein n=1 Tax=Qipengyuania sp. TaxID=2004515 RepID=UPI003BAABD0D
MTNDGPTGYGKPPRSTRFKKGQSGNPKGRPKGSRREAPYEDLLGELVTIRDEGETRQVTVEQAFLLQLMHKGLKGESAENRYVLDAVQQARTRREQAAVEQFDMPVKFIKNGVDVILEDLGLAVLKFSTDKSRARWELNPWIVEKALDRIGVLELSEEEQRIVWEATRTPRKVKWPEWWTYEPE